jgi:hypothetical protein
MPEPKSLTVTSCVSRACQRQTAYCDLQGHAGSASVEMAERPMVSIIERRGALGQRTVSNYLCRKEDLDGGWLCSGGMKIFLDDARRALEPRVNDDLRFAELIEEMASDIDRYRVTVTLDGGRNPGRYAVTRSTAQLSV